MPTRPWLKWYPRDWRADPRLRMCSLAARGLWIELIGYMHEADPYGYLAINEEMPSIEDISALVGRPLIEVRRAMAELAEREVFSTREDDGMIYSRRMVRDKAKEETDRVNGKGGGNPKLREPDKGGVNPPLKAHMPEAREQKKKDAPAAPSDAEKELFDRGREVLGKEAGGLVMRLLKAKSGCVPLARAALEAASTKSDPREYVGAIVRAPPAAANPWEEVDRVRRAKGSAVVLEGEAKIPGLS